MRDFTLGAPEAVGGVVTVTVPLSPAEFAWLTELAAKRKSTIEIQAGKMLRSYVRNRVRARDQQRAYVEGLNDRATK